MRQKHPVQKVILHKLEQPLQCYVPIYEGTGKKTTTREACDWIAEIVFENESSSANGSGLVATGVVGCQGKDSGYRASANGSDLVATGVVGCQGKDSGYRALGLNAGHRNVPAPTCAARSDVGCQHWRQSLAIAA
jgi:hypothetical protein